MMMINANENEYKMKIDAMSKIQENDIKVRNRL